MEHYKNKGKTHKTTVTKCKNCGIEFLAKSTLAKFCGAACKQASFLEKVSTSFQTKEVDIMKESEPIKENESPKFIDKPTPLVEFRETEYWKEIRNRKHFKAFDNDFIDAYYVVNTFCSGKFIEYKDPNYPHKSNK